MTTQHELETIVRTAFAHEVEAMDIDTYAAGTRLHRELDRQTVNRRLAIGVAAAVVAGLLALWLSGPWSQKETPPARPMPTHTASATTLASAWPYRVDLDTGAVRPLPKNLLPDGYEGSFSISFTRDGARVAVGTCHASTVGCVDESSLEVVALVTGTRTSVPIPADRWVAGASWATDDRHLVYRLTDGPNAIGELYTYDVVTRRSHRITNIALNAAWWWQLIWSTTPRGTVLHDLPTNADTTGGWNIWEVPIDGGPASIRLRNARAPAALPDGRIAYVVPRPGEWAGSAVAIAELDGTRRTVATAQDEILDISASPDGTRLAYPDGSYTWIIDLPTGARHRLLEGKVIQWIDENTLLIAPS